MQHNQTIVKKFQPQGIEYLNAAFINIFIWSCTLPAQHQTTDRHSQKEAGEHTGSFSS